MDNNNLNKQELESSSENESDKLIAEEEQNNIPEELPGEMELDTKDKKATISGSKALLNLLLKKKIIIWGLIVVLVAFLVVVLVITLNSSGTNDYIYQAPSCTTVTVNYAPVGDQESSSSTMDLEEYIKEATYAYTKDITTPPTGIYQVYTSLAIALRNEVLTNNCQITFKDIQLNNNVPDDDIRDNALEHAKGIIMVTSEGYSATVNEIDSSESNDNTSMKVESKDLLNVDTSSFCWNQKQADYYNIYQANNLKVTTSFTDVYLKNEVYKNCECNKYSGIMEDDTDDGEDDICWYRFEKTNSVTKVVTKYKEWRHQEKTSGYSLYGAYFLMMNYGYGQDEILHYFFGNFNYRTVDDSTAETTKSASYQNGNMSSSCATSSATSNLITFLDTFEGTGKYCDSGNGYQAYDGGDGTITVGHGVTNYDFGSVATASYINQNSWSKYFNSSGKVYSIEAGDCLPVSIIDQIKLNSLENNYAKPIDTFATQYNVSLTQFQKDALTSFNYNVGTGKTENLISSYASGGYEGLWNYMKQFYHSQGKELAGLKKRRKAEFALFVTGDYTDQGLFYSRGLSDYDNYDSEGVMERKAICGSTNIDGFALPLPTNAKFSCTSPFGWRVVPTAGATANHQGLDLGVSEGTEIYAAKAGVVTSILNNVSGSSPSSGNYVKIKHSDGTSSAYMHMIKGSVKVSVGENVKQGQLIGLVGQTGAATGPHLHFTIYDANGTPVDPYPYLAEELAKYTNTNACHY